MNTLTAQLTRPVARWLTGDHDGGARSVHVPVVPPPEGTGVRVRRRHRADVDACVRVLRGISSGGRYPVPRPASHREWITDVLDAWVAERRGIVVGHVALAQPTAPLASALRWREVTGMPVADLASVVGFFVQRHERDQGIGAALLATAVEGARARGLRPVVEVVSSSRYGVPLLERSGWQLAARTPFGRRGDDRTTYAYTKP